MPEKRKTIPGWYITGVRGPSVQQANIGSSELNISSYLSAG
jgi:hypothetical protein